MPTVVRCPSTDYHVEIRDAIAWARANRVFVAPSNAFGVICVSQGSLAMWERDPRASGINPIGAAILRTQPQTDDVDDAAALAVGAPIAWLDGFCDGLARVPPPSVPRTNRIAARQFAEGYVAGTMARDYLHRAEVVNVPPSGQVS